MRGRYIAQIAREILVAAPCDQPLPQDDMGREPLHDHAIEFSVVVVDLGYQRAYMGRDGGVVAALEEGPLRRHRPRRPGGANVRQRLLDADRALRSLAHDKDEIEIAVAHFADLPILWPTAEPCADVF